MRIIGHCLFSFALIAIAGTAIHLGFEWMETTNFLVGPNGARVSRSTAYRISSSHWLEFGLTEQGPVRVLSNCAFNRLSEDSARYAVDYELLDSSDRIVLSGRYHLRAQITLLHAPHRADGASPLAKTSYADTRLAGSNSVGFWIDAPDLDLPGRLRIRIAKHANAIVEVSVRAYQRTELSPRKARSAWQRLSRRKREQLVRGFALPSDWLEPFETTALASHTWRPLGPKGVENEDYEERILVIVNDPEFERYRGNPLSDRTRTDSPTVVRILPEEAT